MPFFYYTHKLLIQQIVIKEKTQKKLVKKKYIFIKHNKINEV